MTAAKITTVTPATKTVTISGGSQVHRTLTASPKLPKRFTTSVSFAMVFVTRVIRQIGRAHV